MEPNKRKKLDALISDLQALVNKHNMVVDKYQHEGKTEYFFKLQFEDVEVNIEDVFHPIYHGPPHLNK
jgi:hypothetical protein